MGQVEEDLAMITRFVARKCAHMSDRATFASLRCAIENLTGFVVLFRYDYSMGEGEALLLDDQSGMFEVWFNPDYCLPHHWRHRKKIAHELFHVLKRSPIAISEVFSLAGEHQYDEDALANVFAALMEAVRPAVATRRIKTKDQLDDIVGQFKASLVSAENKAAPIFEAVLAQAGDKIRYTPPLHCPVEHEILPQHFYHEHKHNISPASIWP